MKEGRKAVKIAGGLFLIMSLLGAGMTSPLYANNGSDGSATMQNDVFKLGEIEVVAQKEDKVQNVTVEKITDKKMRLFNTDNLADTLNLLPGVTLSPVGARNEMMVDVRGFDIKHVPIFLDGVPIYVPYDGYPDLNMFNTFNLSEITLSKGFTSVLYGPNTMGGAINMISRRPVKKIEMNAGSGFSSDQTYTEYTNFGSNHGNWYIQGGGSYIKRDHTVLSGGFTPTATQGKGNRNNSYFNDWTVNLKLALTPNATDEYALSFIDQQGSKGVPPYAGTDTSVWPRYWQWPYWDHQSVYFNSDTWINKNNYVKTTLYYETFDNCLFSFDDNTYSTMTKPYAFKSWYADYTYGGSAEVGTRMFSDNFIKVALHYKDDVHREHDNGTPWQRFEDRIYSVGLQDTVKISNKLYSTLGLSYDRVDTVQAQNLDSSTNALYSFPLGSTDAYNPEAGLFYKLTDTDTLHLTVAKKSRLPALKDKFSYRLGTAIPNPYLKPEKSTNYEMGYKGLFFKKITTEANLFYSNVRDYILDATIPDPSNSGQTIEQNQNIGKIDLYGAELSLSGRLLPSLKGGISYTYLQYVNKSSDAKLLDIPNDKIFSYLEYFTPIKDLRLLGSIECNTEQYSSSDGVRVAKGFTVANIKAMYAIYQALSIEAGINNLTDKNCALEEGYPMEGRTYFTNLTYHY